MTEQKVARDWDLVVLLAEEHGWRRESQDVEFDDGLAYWLVDRYVNEVGSVVELMWCKLAHREQFVFKHGVYVSGREGGTRKGQIKAVFGPGHGRLYLSVEKALKEL